MMLVLGWQRFALHGAAEARLSRLFQHERDDAHSFDLAKSVTNYRGIGSGTDYRQLWATAPQTGGITLTTHWACHQR